MVGAASKAQQARHAAARQLRLNLLQDEQERPRAHGEGLALHSPRCCPHLSWHFHSPQTSKHIATRPPSSASCTMVTPSF